MISVRNLLPQLSGSKIILLLGLILLTSCELLKPVSGGNTNKKDKEEELDPIGGGRIYNPETGEYEPAGEVVIAKMDTIRWREISTIDYPPITSRGKVSDNTRTSDVIAEGDRGTKFLESYNVALMLPFLTDRFAFGQKSLDQYSNYALQFYTGAKLALDQLNQEGIRLNVEVFDTKSNRNAFQSLLAQDTSRFIKRAHLMMGVVNPNCVAVGAAFAKQFQIPYVSPFYAGGAIKDNSFYIQINPTLEAHLTALTEHARNNYNSDQIVIVTTNNRNEVAMMRDIQRINQKLAGSSFAPSFEELRISDDSPMLDNTDLSNVIRTDRETVFILPMWEDKQFIYSFLRKASLASQENPVVVYGMRQWLNFNDADYNYFENLKLHISGEYYVDDYATDFVEFQKKYFEAYSTIPSSVAVRGYDNMLYFGRMLNRHGTKFYEFFDAEQLDMIHTRYNIEPEVTVEKNNYGQEVIGRIERFENQYVHILKFADFYFQRAE